MYSPVVFCHHGLLLLGNLLTVENTAVNQLPASSPQRPMLGVAAARKTCKLTLEVSEKEMANHQISIQDKKSYHIPCYRPHQQIASAKDLSGSLFSPRH